MNIEELREWLAENLSDAESWLERIKESNRKMPLPDIVARRVIETEAMVYRNILRKIS